MSRDLLLEATQALREEREEHEEHEGLSDTSEETRARLVTTLERRRHYRRAAVWIVTITIASLCATTSWAAISGRLPTIVRDVFHVFAPSSSSSAEGDAPGATQDEAIPRRATGSRRPPVAIAEPPDDARDDIERDDRQVSDSPEVAFPSTPHSTVPRNPSHVKSRDVRAPSEERERLEEVADTHPREAPSIEESGAAPESLERPDAPDIQALYQAAHDAHFLRHDYRSALAAWDRYLSVSPSGSFVLEARFNRAIALVRLGRRQSAIVALRPFAEGVHGGYRQQEATQLIETLERFASSDAP